MVIIRPQSSLTANHKITATYLLEVADYPADNYYLRLLDEAGQTQHTASFIKQ